MKTIVVLENQNIETNKKTKIEKDITVYKIEKEEKIKGDTITITTKRTPINLTRKINETAKVLKQMTAQEKLKLIADAIK